MNNLISKTKFYQLCIVLVAMLAFSSCQDELMNEKAEEEFSTKTETYKGDYESYSPIKSEFFVPLEEAREIASRMDLSFPMSNEKVKPRKVESYIVVNKGEEPLYYIFNMYKEQGFAIISADRRSVPVLACGPSGSFEPGEVSAGVLVSLKEFRANILGVREELREVNEDVLDMWMKLPGSNQEIEWFKNGRTSARYVGYTYHNRRIPAKWGQGCGYNEKLASCGSGGSCGRVLTGCVATATGQLMRYHQYPTYYNWSRMPYSVNSDDGIRHMGVDHLMYSLGSHLNMNYGCSASGTQTKKARKVLVNKYNYHSSTDYKKYNINELANSMNGYGPVILRGATDERCFLGFCWSEGSGHAWITDGYWSSNYSSGRKYKYLRMNFGWNGSKDGWYYQNTSFEDFDYQKHMIVWARPA